MADDLWPYRFKNKQKLQSGTKRTSLLKSKNRTPAKKNLELQLTKKLHLIESRSKIFQGHVLF